MNLRVASSSVSPIQMAWRQATSCALVLLAATGACAQVNAVESFDLGVGTRFDLFLDNDITRPLPGTMNPEEPPLPGSFIPDAFGGVRMYPDGDGNIVTNHFGFTSTNNAGGLGVGEFGGEFNWLDYGGVADTTLGGQLNPSQEVVIQATMRLDNIGGNDETITLGYYDLPVAPVGSDFSRSHVKAGIGFVGGPRFFLLINGSNSGAINIPGGFDPETKMTEVFDVDLTLKFDSDQGMAWFEGMVAGIPINEFTFSNSAAVDNSWNSFAIAQSFLREAQDAYRRGVAWIDDLTYSVVSDLGIDTADPPRISGLGTVGNGGDYNGDGLVDAADYVVWRDNVGAMGSPGSVFGDGTGDDLTGAPDGDVDQFDYDYWVSQFGNTVPNGNGAGLVVASVPEPASVLLMLLGGMLVGCRFRRSL